MMEHKKAFGIYHWDTFEESGEDTILVDEADSLEEAERKVVKWYGPRIVYNGADEVQIVNRQGEVVKRYPVG
jgi:hypothetical protein